MIREVVHRTITKMKATEAKLWYKYMDTEAVIRWIYTNDTAYIVGNFLVVYQIGSPWYADNSTLFLNELLVLRLVRGGSFQIVPKFLTDKALEAGAAVAVVGTALAKSDAALASIYGRSGFAAEATTLIKETAWAE